MRSEQELLQSRNNGFFLSGVHVVEAQNAHNDHHDHQNQNEHQGLSAALDRGRGFLGMSGADIRAFDQFAVFTECIGSPS